MPEQIAVFNKGTTSFPREALWSEVLTAGSSAERSRVLRRAKYSMTCRVNNGSDPELKAAKAVNYFGASSNPWLFTASEGWLGPNALLVLSKTGLIHKLDFTGMVAKRLRPPVRTFPPGKIRMVLGADL